MDCSFIIHKLNAMNDGRWNKQNIEFQDSGRFILISLDVADNKTISDVISMRSDLKSVLGLLLKDYDWMVVFKSQERVFDSIIKNQG